MGKPLVFPVHPGFYGLRDWVWDIDVRERQRFIHDHRPFVGLNPTLERVTNG